jgi:hypothetical protein
MNQKEREEQNAVSQTAEFFQSIIDAFSQPRARSAPTTPGKGPTASVYIYCAACDCGIQDTTHEVWDNGNEGNWAWSEAVETGTAHGLLQAVTEAHSAAMHGSEPYFFHEMTFDQTCVILAPTSIRER